MTEKAISLADFLLDYPLWGKYQVAYTNDTHLDPGCWIDLCSVEVQGDEQQAKEYPVLPFLLRHNSKSELEGAIKNTDGSIDAEDAARIIHDQLKESMIRCGIILPS
ncbi:MAG: hypothetical protein M5R40_16965 [Anaerolineae bacterium]|nr:hypothetical protein [Anaerolineae bacterium]